MSKVSTAKALAGGKVDTMTAHAATATRTRTGGPGEDGPKIVEQVLGWVLVAVVAMLVTRLGLL
ncbi:hypothetical protein AQJ64_36255 [Streptomyces griseoruber]|uniref:SCO1431 family membrane protein n=1 Tax=Streptomyces griseoruber TaxID=1943 RepID=A0A117R8E9_9ACTN|nr:hypothetical protein AQJ64_36255 [Streptomyces griseoruber]